MTTDTGEKRLNRKEAADYLTARGYRTAAATLAKMATLGGGPVYESFGRTPLYKPTDLLAWIASKNSGPKKSSSEPASPRPPLAAFNRAAWFVIGTEPRTKEAYYSRVYVAEFPGVSPFAPIEIAEYAKLQAEQGRSVEIVGPLLFHKIEESGHKNRAGVVTFALTESNQ